MTTAKTLAKMTRELEELEDRIYVLTGGRELLKGQVELAEKDLLPCTDCGRNGELARELGEDVVRCLECGVSWGFDPDNLPTPPAK